MKELDLFKAWLKSNTRLKDSSISTIIRSLRRIDLSNQKTAEESIKSKKLTKQSIRRYKANIRKYFADYKGQKVNEFFYINIRTPKIRETKKYINKETFNKIVDEIDDIFKYNIAQETKVLLEGIYHEGLTVRQIRDKYKCCNVSDVAITNRLNKIKEYMNLNSFTIRELRRGYYINLLTDKYECDIRRMMKEHYYNTLDNNGIIAFYKEHCVGI